MAKAPYWTAGSSARINAVPVRLRTVLLTWRWPLDFEAVPEDVRADATSRQKARQSEDVKARAI